MKRWFFLLALLVSVPAAGALLEARAPRQTQDRQRPERWPDNTEYDGTFKFARIWYDTRGFRRFGEPPWHHDYPFAERNLGSILGELTLVRAFREGGNVFRLGDPELFRYPVAILSEPGEWEPSDEEIEALRAYLQKGGFVMFDDFTGERALRQLAANMQKAWPGIVPVPLTRDAPIFQSFFEIETLEMLHPYRGVPAQFFGFFVDNDASKRMVAVANYNNDLGELWEYSAEGFFPVDLTNEAYKFGVNYVLYTLTR
ncbi:MAG TPA: DUF4159 domain-containing protein [Longimicrobiales bacterium]|nr:DUF4159 domain-containing protein [Longimicrobiales bacterium]